MRSGRRARAASSARRQASSASNATSVALALSTVDAIEDVEVIKFTAVDLNIKEDGAAKVARKVFNAFVEAEVRGVAACLATTTRAASLDLPRSTHVHASRRRILAWGS